MTYASRRDRWCSIFGIVSVLLLSFGTEASSLDTIHMAITGKNFQHVIYPIAQEKGYMRAALKALRFICQDRDATITAYVKFSGVDRSLATRMYDDLIGTFTRDGTVDEETQKNDLSIIRQIADVSEPIPIARAYDFSFAYAADSQLSQVGWRS